MAYSVSCCITVMGGWFLSCPVALRPSPEREGHFSVLIKAQSDLIPVGHFQVSDIDHHGFAVFPSQSTGCDRPDGLLIRALKEVVPV